MAMQRGEFKSFDGSEVDAIEAKIDRSLREPSDRMLTFDTRGWSTAVKHEIERRYKAAGWGVEFVDDQRDGAYMVLK